MRHNFETGADGGNDRARRQAGKKQSTRSRERTGASKFQVVSLVTDHGRVEEAQHLADRVRDRRGAAAGKEQAYRPGIRGHIFHHQ